jgi:hypothetical protein
MELEEADIVEGLKVGLKTGPVDPPYFFASDARRIWAPTPSSRSF